MVHSSISEAVVVIVHLVACYRKHLLQWWLHVASDDWYRTRLFWIFFKKKNGIVYRFSYSIIHLTKKADCLQCWICASCIKKKLTTIKSITRRVKRFGLWQVDHILCDILGKNRSSYRLNRLIEWLVRQLLDYRWRKLHFLMCLCYHLQHRYRDRRYSREPLTHKSRDFAANALAIYGKCKCKNCKL